MRKHGLAKWSLNVIAQPPVNVVRARVHFNILAVEDNASGTVTVDFVALQSKK